MNSRGTLESVEVVRSIVEESYHSHFAYAEVDSPGEDGRLNKFIDAPMLLTGLARSARCLRVSAPRTLARRLRTGEKYSAGRPIL